MTNTILSIMIDQREPPWIQNIDFGVPAAISLLDAGDLWAATSDNSLLIIERKTPQDLLHSIADNRLFNQVARMKELSPWCYVVITGNLLFEIGTGRVILDYKATGWDINAIQGALLSIQELGCFVVICRSDDDFGPCVQRLAARSRDTIKVAPVRQPRILSAGETVLASLPGVGWQKTKDLLDFCDTPAWALSYLTRLGENGVPGIGDNTKRAIRHALGLKDNWELWPILAENDQSGQEKQESQK